MPQRWRVSQFLLGVEGLGLLRRWLTGDPREVGERVREIAELCRRFEDPPPEDVIEVDEVDASTGYDALAETYDDIENALIFAEEPALRLLLDTLRRGRVVDAACGTGRHAGYLVALGHAVTGVDASAAMVQRARTKVPGASFVRGDVVALPLPTDSHDAAVCSLALTHLPELELAIGELSRVVRPGGDVILSDVHPFAAVTGAHVPVKKEEGGVALVRNHFHPHSRYFDAFARHGLQVRACIEPPWETERYSATLQQTIPEAAAVALDGLPFALIWHLTN